MVGHFQSGCGALTAAINFVWHRREHNHTDSHSVQPLVSSVTTKGELQQVVHNQKNPPDAGFWVGCILYFWSLFRISQDSDDSATLRSIRPAGTILLSQHLTTTAFSAGPAMILPFSFVIIVVYIRIFTFVSRHNRKHARLMSSRSTRSSNRVDRISNNAFDKSPVKFDPTSLSMRNAMALERSDDHIMSTSDSIISGEVTDTNLSIEDNASSLNDRQERSLPSRLKRDHYIKSRHRTPEKRTQSRSQRHHIAVTKRLSIVVLVFFACLLPFGISSVAPGSEPGIPWTGLLVTFNSCINPIIYAGTMPVFRQVMGCIIRCRFSKIPKPVDLIRRTL